VIARSRAAALRESRQQRGALRAGRTVNDFEETAARLAIGRGVELGP
jgi:hypothetical protein